MTDPKLYIIMRRDIQDMNPGKAMAQSAHAQADFAAWMRVILQQPKQYGELIGEFERWTENRSFGVTLVLHETLETIKQIVENTNFGGLTVDPTYPWRNFYGDVFTSNEVTCGWVFVCSESNLDEEQYLKQFSLHR
jgi:peptidyl-tRNA hydrolase